MTAESVAVTMGVMFQAVVGIYRQSLKPRDTFWNNYVSRPPAAIFVWALRETRVTPNQVTFASLAVFAGAAAILIAWRSWLGLVVAALVVQSSYVLDCVDGQLARYKSLTTSVGAHLDFLMDEVKAFLLVGACAVRQWAVTGRVWWLLVGVAGLFVVATGIALTTFMRRPEYLEATGTGGGGTGGGNSLVRAVEWAGRTVIQYPAHFWVWCAANRLELFVWIYLGANLLYLGRSSLAVLVKLGRPLRKAA